MKVGFALMKNVLKPLAKSVLAKIIRINRTSVSSSHRNSQSSLGLEITTLIISNEEMEDINKVDKSLKESSLLIKGVSETTENEAK